MQLLHQTAKKVQYAKKFINTYAHTCTYTHSHKMSNTLNRCWEDNVTMDNLIRLMYSSLQQQWQQLLH